MVHLINVTGDMQRPISNIVSLHNIKIRVRGKPPRRALKLSDKKLLDIKRIDENFELTLDRLNVYDVIVLEF